MTSLPRHIEILLLDHNCVIVPQLGGFVAQTLPARRIPDEQTMLPAYRTVGFNAQLRMNDGLLAESYMKVMGIGYGEAMAAISNDVLRLKEQLYREGRCELGGVGCLYQKVDGGYEFEPLLSGITSPALYGLDAFTLNCAMETDTKASDTKVATTAPTKEGKDTKHYTIRLNKEVVNYVAAALVALVFYLAWALPGHHADRPEAAGQAAVMSTSAHTYNATKDNASPAAKLEAPANPVAPSQTNVLVAPKPALTRENENNATAGQYALVMATAVTPQGAQDLVAKLTHDGYKEARTVRNGKFLQVVCGSFATEAEARERLAALRGVDYFKDSWVTRTAE